jgi:acetyl-CoA acetyltransferase
MKEAWIIDTCRTPRGIGKRGKGALSNLHPQQLGSAVLKALAERNSIDTAQVDDIIWGTSSQRGQQSGCPTMALMATASRLSWITATSNCAACIHNHIRAFPPMS